MLRTIIAAALLMPTAASANSTIAMSKDGLTAAISYRDLNLASRPDRAELTGRIRRAANQLCLEDYNVAPLTAVPSREECFRNALASGVGQMEEIVSRLAD